MRNTTHLGIKGEQEIAKYLHDRGWSVLTQNYTARCGEIDVIAQRGDVVVFVEVKTRRAAYFPIATVVTKSKQQKIVRTAKRFLLETGIEDVIVRFDVATVLSNNNDLSITYIEDAFRAS